MKCTKQQLLFNVRGRWLYNYTLTSYIKPISIFTTMLLIDVSRGSTRCPILDIEAQYGELVMVMMICRTMTFHFISIRPSSFINLTIVNVICHVNELHLMRWAKAHLIHCYLCLFPRIASGQSVDFSKNIISKCYHQAAIFQTFLSNGSKIRLMPLRYIKGDSMLSL